MKAKQGLTAKKANRRGYKKYDLHVHTHYSKCAGLMPEEILRIAKKKKLAGVAITDHNTIKGALEVKKLNKKKEFEVIIGEEISTDKGEIIGLGLRKNITPGKIFDVIRAIKKQNGLVGIPHPYSSRLMKKSIMLKLTEKEKKMLMKQTDFIEVINGRTGREENKKAKKLAQKNKKAERKTQF